MANIEDCPGFETFGADVKAARKAKRLSRKTMAEIINVDARYLAKYRERRNDPQPAGCYTAYQRVRLTCGTVLQPGNHAGRKRTEAADQPQAETLSRAVFTDHRGSD